MADAYACFNARGYTDTVQHITANLVSSHVIDLIQLRPSQFIESRRQYCHRHRPEKNPLPLESESFIAPQMLVVHMLHIHTEEV